MEKASGIPRRAEEACREPVARVGDERLTSMGTKKATTILRKGEPRGGSSALISRRMGRASSRPRSRRASGGVASADAFVDVAGITAERAAEGSGSEWSSDSEKEENARERAVVPRPEGTVEVAAGADARVAVTRVGDDARASPLVRVFLFTDEKGLESARPVTVRLVVASRPLPFVSSGTYGDVLRASSPKSSTTPFWIGSIAERLAGLAGAWPAWDVRRSSKAKTFLETQLEDFKNATPYAPTEPRRDEGHENESDEREKEKRKENAPPSNPSPPMPWSPDLSESERAARWRYAGGGMHQPVHGPATPAERWVAGRTKSAGSSRGGVSAITAEALETSAEVALAVDGERALSPRAAAAAAELVRRARREAGNQEAFFSSASRDTKPAAVSRKKRAKTPPTSETRLPLPATSLAACAKEKGVLETPSSEEKKAPLPEKEDEPEKEDAGVAAFSSAEKSKLWGAWSPSVQRRRRRRLDYARGGGSLLVGDVSTDDEDDEDERKRERERAKSLFPAKEKKKEDDSFSRPSPVFPGGGSGRSSGYEEEDDPTDDKPTGDSESSTSTSASSSDVGAPARDEENVD